MDEPDLVEYSYPRFFSLSAKITVALRPQCLYEVLIKSETTLLVKVLFTISKANPSGTTPHKIDLPTVVSTSSSSPSKVLILTLIFAWRSTLFVS